MHGLDSSCLIQKAVAGPFEHGNEFLNSLKGGGISSPAVDAYQEGLCSEVTVIFFEFIH